MAYEARSSEVCQVVGDYFNDESSVIKLDKIESRINDSFVDDSRYHRIDLDKPESHAINYFLTQYKGLLRVKNHNHSEVLIDWSLQHDVDVNHFIEDIAVKCFNNI